MISLWRLHLEMIFPWYGLLHQQKIIGYLVQVSCWICSVFHLAIMREEMEKNITQSQECLILQDTARSKKQFTWSLFQRLLITCLGKWRTSVVFVQKPWVYIEPFILHWSEISWDRQPSIEPRSQLCQAWTGVHPEGSCCFSWLLRFLILVA